MVPIYGPPCTYINEFVKRIRNVSNALRYEMGYIERISNMYFSYMYSSSVI